MKDFNLDFDIDSTELGKAITFISVGALLFSIHGFYMMDDVQNDISDAERQMEQGLDYVESEDSQRIIEALSDSRGLSEEFNGLQQGFQTAENSLNSTRSASKTVESARRNYQWMVVIFFSTAVAGITIMLIELG